MMTKKKLSVVIPVYNSASILPRLISRLDAVLKTCVHSHEVILVNDGSLDDSWEIIRQLVNDKSWVMGINLMRNYGQHNALLCGIRKVNNEIIITMDDDLQHPPEEIPILLDKLAEGYDVVYGTPRQEQHNFFRKIASNMTKLTFQRAMGVENARNVSAFRAFRTHVSKAFSDYHGPFTNIDAMLTWGTISYSSVTVEHAPRDEGVSMYTYGKLLNHALNMMTDFSVLPLRLASLMGLGFAAFGGLILIYVLVVFLVVGRVVPGFVFTASIITIFSGAQLLSLGIIGEYLARMHFRLMNKPTYVIKETLKQDE